MKKHLIGRHFCRFAIFAAAGLLMVWSSAQAAQSEIDRAGTLLATRALDERVAAIGHRLAVSSLDLCRDRQWLPGFTVHHLGQYGDSRDRSWRSAAIRAFGLGVDPAVLAVVVGGPAERAGMRRDDHLLSVDGVRLPMPAERSRGRDNHMGPVFDAVERAFADGAALVEVRRGDEELALRIEAERGCASRFQVTTSPSARAYANGTVVDITTTMIGHAADDAELAWVLAHEFAHNVLRHHERLDAADVARGFLGNFGRNARHIRETETEADRLSVYLLDRAGYDPEAGIRFWTHFSQRGLNFLGSPTHPNWRRRVGLFRAEIAAVRRARSEGAVPWPAFLPRISVPES